MSRILITITLIILSACTATSGSNVKDGTDKGRIVTFDRINDGTDRSSKVPSTKTTVKEEEKKPQVAIKEERKVEETYSVPSSNKSSGFLYPISNPKITKQFKESNFGGIEFKTEESQNIYAIGPGMVIFSGIKPSLGNSVFVYHNDGYVSIYTDLDKLNLKKGDYIRDNNSIIGTANNTFKFELRKRTEEGVIPLNPTEHLKERG